MLKILDTVVEIGLEEPVKVLHITDAHITESDEGDDSRMKELIETRRRTFFKEGGCPDAKPQDYLAEALELAEREGAFPVLTGDIMDLNSSGNRAVLHKLLDGRDFLFTAGTHEMQRSSCTPRCCPLEEPGTYYEDTRAALQREFLWNWDSDSRVVGGVDLVTLDDSQGFFTLDSYNKLRAELEKGLPLALFMHVPINCETLGFLPHEPPYEYYRFSREEYEISRRTVDLIRSHHLVKATFAGHWHTDSAFPDLVPPTWVTPGTFSGAARMIEFR